MEGKNLFGVVAPKVETPEAGHGIVLATVGVKVAKAKALAACLSAMNALKPIRLAFNAGSWHGFMQ